MPRRLREGCPRNTKRNLNKRIDDCTLTHITHKRAVEPNHHTNSKYDATVVAVRDDRERNEYSLESNGAG